MTVITCHLFLGPTVNTDSSITVGARYDPSCACDGALCALVNI